MSYGIFEGQHLHAKMVFESNVCSLLCLPSSLSYVRICRYMANSPACKFVRVYITPAQLSLMLFRNTNFHLHGRPAVVFMVLSGYTTVHGKMSTVVDNGLDTTYDTYVSCPAVRTLPDDE
jgi:hypothetical protein